MALQLLGAGLIVTGFILLQTKKVISTNIFYLAINLIGSVVLFYVAFKSQQWGFLIIEAVWAITSAYGIYTYFVKKGELSEI